MSACARPDTRPSERMNTSVAIADRTPMSRTRPARSPNSSASSAGSPNNFTSVAPGAEKRSVICDVIAALWPGRLALEPADAARRPGAPA